MLDILFVIEYIDYAELNCQSIHFFFRCRFLWCDFEPESVPPRVRSRRAFYKRALVWVMAMVSKRSSQPLNESNFLNPELFHDVISLCTDWCVPVVQSSAIPSWFLGSQRTTHATNIHCACRSVPDTRCLCHIQEIWAQAQQRLSLDRLTIWLPATF